MPLRVRASAMEQPVPLEAAWEFSEVEEMVLIPAPLVVVASSSVVVIQVGNIRQTIQTVVGIGRTQMTLLLAEDSRVSG